MICRDLKSLADEPVSHNPLVRKQVWIRNGEIQNITQVSRATMPPGEVCAVHSHLDMWEMFIIESGEGVMTIDGSFIALESGTCLILEPGESHELKNASSSPLIFITMGWTKEKPEDDLKITKTG